MMLLRVIIYGAAACAVVCCLAALAVVVWVGLYIALSFRDRERRSISPIITLRK